MHDGYDGFHLAYGLRPFWKEFYEETFSVERIRGVCVDVLALLRKVPAPPGYVRTSVCARERASHATGRGGVQFSTHSGACAS